MREKHAKVNGPLLKKKAIELSKKMEILNFISALKNRYTKDTNNNFYSLKFLLNFQLKLRIKTFDILFTKIICIRHFYGVTCLKIRCG